MFAIPEARKLWRRKYKKDRDSPLRYLSRIEKTGGILATAGR